MFLEDCQEHAMIDPLVNTDGGATILGGGEATAADVTEALSHAPTLVCADGGAVLASQIGRLPIAIIGDMDSLPAQVRRKLPASRVHKVDEQDSTDFEKCLDRIQARFVLGVGLTGQRLDHELAAMHAVVARPDQTIILLGRRDIIFHAPSEVTLYLRPETRVSLFPMALTHGTSTGLRWKIDGLDFKPGARVGTSNIAEGPVTLSFDTPGMLVILPRAALRTALMALTGSDAARAR